MMIGSVKRLAAATAIAAAIAIGGAVASHAEDAPAGDPVNGKRLYLADGCFECHGRAGQGGRFNYLTPALAQIALPVESFIAFLREAPNDMPSFSADVLSDKDAADIHAYLSSLPGPKAPKDIPPILNQ
ncbi:cytochrome c [Bradyrhizobium sp. Pear76]|uniref:c-type cytochrome n=1 Tax=Bradyrhizobium oropedii TaxID=1571201 RepID=UPI001E5AF056|nr:cytochrome c [Bradyrhizobium oropedii]MCC8961419.1 cytochrome c [Bradyrhizobium oropedii]